MTVWLAGVALRTKSGMVTTSVTVAECVSVPLTPVPVMVRVYPPVGVATLVVKESVDDPVVGLVLKLPPAPVGSPVTLSVTCPLKPLVGVTVTPKDVEPPWITVWLDGVAVSMKSGDALTTRVTVAVCVRVPLTPVIVTVYVPGGVFEPVVTEKVEEELAGLGEKLPLAPAGNPVAPKVTCPVKPLLGVIVSP